MNVDKIKKRAARGAKLLDKKIPGWQYSVSIARLDMASVNNCVLAQAHDFGYVFALEYLFGVEEKAESAIRYGFDCSSLKYSARESFTYFDHLTDAWVSEIRNRRASLA